MNGTAILTFLVWAIALIGVITTKDQKRKISVVLLILITLVAVVSLYKASNDTAKELRRDAKTTELITKVEELTELQNQLIIEKMEEAKEPHRARLENDYKLGHAVLYVDKNKNWFWSPAIHTTKLSLDWYSTEIVSVSEDRIKVKMPKLLVGENRLILRNFILNMPRKVGANEVYFKSTDVSIIAECLKATGDETILVIGVTQRRI